MGVLHPHKKMLLQGMDFLGSLRNTYFNAA